MAKTVLIVEDDRNIADLLRLYLEKEGYEVVIANDGLKGVELFKSSQPSLVLLDVMLPGLDGFSVIQRIQSDKTPVIFLTAVQDVADKVRGLKLGAEDYIVKPFEAVELLARVEVVLRRTNRGKTQICYGDITVNLDEHVVKKGNDPVSLTPKEFDVLVFFLQNTDIALSRERLLSAVWGYEFAGETRTVDIHVQQVRRKMGLQRQLITIPKLGYRLESR